MEKLLQLLNEYDKDSMRTEKSVYAHETGVISKKFGFIQWLVDNDKIDIQWTKNLLYESEIFNLLPYTNLMERLIMYLAIQDDPINFLVSLLK